MLKVKNLTKKVHEKALLNNLSFEVQRGGIAIFLGGSGVGKSTLLRALNHLESYDAGTFTLDEAPLELATVSQNHTVGMVFQHFNLFENLTVEDNITLALIKTQGKSLEEAHKIATNLLTQYGLEEKAKLSIHKLSGGQKQRLAIARTLALNPQIVCMDEPTSALDPKLTNQVAKYIMEIAKDNRIVLVTTHDMGLVHELQGDVSLFLMEKGTIVESVSKQGYKMNPSDFPHLQRFFS